MTLSNLIVKKEGILLEPTSHEFENESVMNPACLQEGNTIHLYYRAVRLGNFSTIGYCRLEGPLTVVERMEQPLLVPEHAYESKGLEDPRVVKIDGTIYLTYTGYDGKNALGAMCTGTSPTQFQKIGIVTPLLTYDEFILNLDRFEPAINSKYYAYYDLFKSMGLQTKDHFVWDKDVVLFPEKIGGRYAMLHRFFPGIQIIYFDSPAEFATRPWVEYLRHLPEFIVLNPELEYESSHVGAGCPPIKTDAGWLLIYHAVQETPNGKRYMCAAALLDLRDPRIVLARLPEPLFVPDQEWEMNGVVDNVVFPCGTSLFGDTLYIYYGAADERIGAASVSLSALVGALLACVTTKASLAATLTELHISN